jgi:Na+/proline symporter
LFGIGTATSTVEGMKNDQLLAYFIVNYMPAGLLGLTLAAVFAAAMSTLSSSLNSSAAAFINDHWLPRTKRNPDEHAVLTAGRLATVAFGVLQIGIAIAFGMLATDESIVSNVLKISGFAAGPVLGLYFLGVFSPRVKEATALGGFVTGVVVLSVLAYSTPLHWAWYAMVGSLVTYAAGNILRRVFR